jgi:exodeoxyribonuclease V alpha subunit
MTTLYEKLGLQSVARRFSPDASEIPQTRFVRHLRSIEAGAAALNLSADSVHLAAEIAAFQSDLDEEQRIGLILLIVISLAALDEGSTRFPITGTQSVEPMRRLLGPLCGETFGADGVERARISIERILSSSSAAVIGTTPNEYKPLIYLPPFIYHHRILAAEIAVAKKLATLINAQNARIDDGTMRDLLLTLNTHSATSNRGHLDLSEEQRAAVERAVTAPLTIISGGPGTGKTSIVLAMLKVLIGVGVDPKAIALAAPTGKAAYRIGESIREILPSDQENPAAGKTWPEPTTVHRLLGYSLTRRRFYHHRGNPLQAQVVVVDEGSMLDLELISRLLDALRPNARLIILGDADQLPSVSAGAVFRDLLPQPGDSTSILARNCMRLTRSFRVNNGEKGGGALFRLAHGINAGDTDLFETGERAAPILRRNSPQEIEFVGAEWIDEETASEAFLERWYTEQLRGDDELTDLEGRIFTALEDGFAPTEAESLRKIFDKVSRSRILCVTRVLDSGSDRINALLRRRAAHDAGAIPGRDQFMAGQPVMMLQNDYARMLFNGDQGVVLRARRQGQAADRMAVFPRGDNFIAFRLEELKERLELCYGMTVHKAQGSEYESVAVIMPNKDIPMLTREILYTAVSRARRSVTIIGSKEVIRAGLSRKIERYSGVREHLAQILS